MERAEAVGANDGGFAVLSAIQVRECCQGRSQGVGSLGWKAREWHWMPLRQGCWGNGCGIQQRSLGDMWSGPGREVYPAEAVEGTNWEAGRSWAAVGQC